ncbi:MAG: hypothetical protein SVG88_09955 [Halobacteriales archaeon]|nr:hypothetical protein [Halobacteriales archaeon]
MDLKGSDTLLRVLVIVALLVGLPFIFFGGPTLTGIGVVLILVSVISFLAVVKNYMTDPQPA